MTCSELFRVSWVNLGYIAGDRRQDLKPKLAQVPKQSDFTYGVYLAAAEHLNKGFQATRAIRGVKG